MKKRSIVRLQLLALAGVTLLLVIRALTGPPRPDGLVVMVNLEPQELRHDGFVLDQPARFTLEATASFAAEPGMSAPAPPLAAYPWILDHDTHELVWTLDPARAVPGRGTLVSVTDTIRLEPGKYDVFFATYGGSLDPRFDANRRGSVLKRMVNADKHWRDDSDRWRLILAGLDTPASASALRVDRIHEVRHDPEAASLLWHSGPVGNGATVGFLFEVQQAARIPAYAVGQFADDRAQDYGWIENAATGEVVWQMTPDNTQPAGGGGVNRRFDGTVSLEPGVYRAVYQTDADHAAGDWVANPPFDPAGWGLTLGRPAQEHATSAFDPWNTRQPIVALTQVGNDEVRMAEFAVHRPLRVLAYGIGEMSSSDRYDFGWIERGPAPGPSERDILDHADDPNLDEAVWVMSRDASERAGGDENNRTVVDFLELDPAVYTVYYRTDGSHAFDDWRNGVPDHPDRWGLTLFPLAPTLDSGDVDVRSLVQIHEDESTPPDVPDVPDIPDVPDVPDVPPVPPVPPPPAAAPLLVEPPPGTPIGHGDVLVNQTPLANETHIEEALDLTAPTSLRIHAVGEITASGRQYDYGYLVDTATGATIWEMTLNNTTHAGGGDENRRFDGIVTLDPGSYVVHFVTDESHAYGDFGERAPDQENLWGIIVERVAH